MISACPVCQRGLEKKYVQNAGIYFECKKHGIWASELFLKSLTFWPQIYENLKSQGISKTGIPCLYCRKKMVVKRLLDLVDIDHCEKCRSVWFDLGEFESLKYLPNQSQQIQTLQSHENKVKSFDELAEEEIKETDARGNIFYYLGLPVETEHNSTHSFSIATLALVSANFLIAVLTLGRLKHFPLEKFYYFPKMTFFENGYRNIFSGLAHADWFHFFGNMYFLCLVADDVENITGVLNTIIIFFAGVLLGHYFYSLSGSEIPSIGASGGVFSLLSFYTLLFPNRQIRFLPLGFLRFYFSKFSYGVSLPVWIYFGLYTIAFEFMYAFVFNSRNDSVNHLAHVGGAVAGLIAFLIYEFSITKNRQT